MNRKYPCKVRMNYRALKEFNHLIAGQPDTLVSMCKFILQLASTKIWGIISRRIYDIHGLTGNLKGIYDVHLPVREGVVVFFEVTSPLKIKIKSIGSHNDVFD